MGNTMGGSALGFHLSHHARPQPEGLEPVASHFVSLSLDLKWMDVALQHCRSGNETFLKLYFVRNLDNNY